MAPIKSQNSNMLLAFLTLLGVIAIVAVVGFFMLRKGPEIIQGQAEVTEYRVSSKVPGRILEFRVKEGQSVNAGDTLAILEAPDVVAKMEQARAAEAAAQAQNAKAIKGAREEQIQAAYEMWQKAQAGVTIAEKSYQRIKNLYEQGVMPAQKLDEVTAQRDASIATEKAAKAQYTMAKNGAEREDKMAAEALVNRAKGAVAEVESYIKETYLIAPAAGEFVAVDGLPHRAPVGQGRDAHPEKFPRAPGGVPLQPRQRPLTIRAEQGVPLRQEPAAEGTAGREQEVEERAAHLHGTSALSGPACRGGTAAGDHALMIIRIGKRRK